MIADLLKLIRWKQWIKNLFVLAPLFFTARFLDLRSVINGLAAFGAFCMASSAVYIMNDFIDLDRDRKHPVKHLRPLASGRIAPPVAGGAGIILLAGSLYTGLMVTGTLFWVLAAYILMNAAYSFYLKHLVLLDVFTIAVGFLLRLLAGSRAVGVTLSKWILVTTFFLALFMGFGKRHKEQQLSEDGIITGRDTRKYNTELLNYLIVICATISLTAYSLYVIDPATCERIGTDLLILTIPIAVFGVFRYMYLIYKQHLGGDPTENLIHDAALMIAILAWAGVFTVVLLAARLR